MRFMDGKYCLDSVDKDILRALTDNARMTLTEISDKTSRSRVAVHRRIKDSISRQAAIGAICNACGKIDCDQMDTCGKIDIQPINSSEIPNSSDTISRKAAIDALNVGSELLRRVLDDADIVGAERAKYEWGLGLIESYISDMKELPSVQPDIVACGDCKRWICHDRRCGYWNHGVKPLDWCSRAERRTDEVQRL